MGGVYRITWRRAAQLRRAWIGTLPPCTPPANTVAPTVSGSFAIGEILTATTGTWTGTATVSFTYQWQRDCGDGWEDIAGETASTYTVTVEDCDCELRVNVTGTNACGSATASSAAITSSGIDEYTVLVLHADGADGSTSFPDASPSAHTVTAFGNAQVDTAQFVFGTGSALFDGTGDYLSVPDSPDWNFAAGDFTLDGRVRFATVPGAGVLVEFVAQRGAAPQRAFQFGYRGGSGLRFSYSADGSSFSDVDRAWTPVVNTWYHVAVVRHGNDLLFFVDGTQVGTTAAIAATIADVTAALTVAANIEGPGQFFDGHIDEIRISRVARWTSNFTPPTAAYAAELASPANVTAPAVSGTLTVGSTLTATTGTWTGSGPIVYTYQWQRNCGLGWNDIAGEVGSTYLVVLADAGCQLRIVVTATNACGSDSAASAAVTIPAPRVLPTGKLGCGEYEAYVLNRGGGTLVGILDSWTNLSWSRDLDETSSASIDVTKSGRCCEFLADVRPWRHELALYRNGALVWVGPIVGMTADYETVKIAARDLTAWWDHRLVHSDHQYTVATDVADIFEAISDDAMLPDNSPGLFLTTTPTGVMITYTVLANQQKIAAAELRTLTDMAIDWTVIARDIRVGGQTVPVTATVLLFTDDHFVSPPTVRLEGLEQVNTVTVIGQGVGEDENAIYSTVADADAVVLDGLLESAITNSDIKDQNGADAAADSELALAAELRVVEAATLVPTAPFEIGDLIPGRLCRVDLDDTCIPVDATVRLSKVAAKASANSESVDVVFEPAGTVA